MGRDTMSDEEKQKSDWPAILFLLVGLPVAVTYGGLLVGLIVIFTDDKLFSMFQIIVLNFAYGAHKHPQSEAFIQQSVGIGFMRRLFS